MAYHPEAFKPSNSRHPLFADNHLKRNTPSGEAARKHTHVDKAVDTFLTKIHNELEKHMGHKLEKLTHGAGSKNH